MESISKLRSRISEVVMKKQIEKAIKNNDSCSATEVARALLRLQKAEEKKKRARDAARRKKEAERRKERLAIAQVRAEERRIERENLLKIRIQEKRDREAAKKKEREEAAVLENEKRKTLDQLFTRIATIESSLYSARVKDVKFPHKKIGSYWNRRTLKIPAQVKRLKSFHSSIEQMEDNLKRLDKLKTTTKKAIEDSKKLQKEIKEKLVD